MMIRVMLACCLVAIDLSGDELNDGKLLGSTDSKLVPSERPDLSRGLVAPGLGQLPPEQFRRFLAKSFQEQDGLPGIPMKWKDQSPTICSIPLTEVKVPHRERFSMKILPVRSREFDQITGANPAPACKNHETR